MIALKGTKTKYYKYGEPDVTLSGGATLTDGVVSGFTSGGLCTLTKYPTNLPSFEIVFKVTTGDNITEASDQCIFGQTTTNRYTPQINLFSSVGNRFWAAISPTGSAWLTITANPVIEANTDYWIKLAWDGATVSAYFSSDNEFTEEDLMGTASATAVKWSENAHIGTDTKAKEFTFDGTIDLKESYINIGGGRWWEGVPLVESTAEDYEFTEEVTTHSLPSSGEKSFTKINVQLIGSSVTNDNGVLGNFTNSSYGLMSSYPTAYTSFEAVFCLIPHSNDGANIIGQSGTANYKTPQFSLGSESQKFSFNVSQTGSAWISTRCIDGPVLNVRNWLKATYDGTTVSLYLSLDGVNYELQSTATATKITWTEPWAIGNDQQTSNSAVFGGEIDLTESYLNVDGERFWSGTDVVSLRQLKSMR